MNTYYFSDETFKTTDLYKSYVASNPTTGYLKIRATGASNAIPISNLKIIVSKTIDNSKIIFYEGVTNESGIIEKITLPTKRIASDDEVPPSYTTYEITATYQNNTKIYKVNMYENIYVVQVINIIPELSVMAGGN